MPRIATLQDLQSKSVHPYTNQPTITIDESKKLMCVSNTYITTNFPNDFDIDNSLTMSYNQLVPDSSIIRRPKEICYFNLSFRSSSFSYRPFIWIHTNTRMGGNKKFGPYYNNKINEILEGVLSVSGIEFVFYGFPSNFTSGEMQFLITGTNDKDYASYPETPNIRRTVYKEEAYSNINIYVPNLPPLNGLRDYYTDITVEAFLKL